LKHIASKSIGQADSLSKRVIERRQLLIEGAEEEIIEKIKKIRSKKL